MRPTTWKSPMPSHIGRIMKKKLSLLILPALAILALTDIRAQTTETTSVTSDGPIFKNVSDLKWDKIIPDLGENSPEICILRVDPKTHATSLLIRTPLMIVCVSLAVCQCLRTLNRFWRAYKQTGRVRLWIDTQNTNLGRIFVQIRQNFVPFNFRQILERWRI